MLAGCLTGLSHKTISKCIKVLFLGWSRLLRRFAWGNFVGIYVAYFVRDNRFVLQISFPDTRHFTLITSYYIKSRLVNKYFKCSDIMAFYATCWYAGWVNAIDTWDGIGMTSSRSSIICEVHLALFPWNRYLFISSSFGYDLSRRLDWAL